MQKRDKVIVIMIVNKEQKFVVSLVVQIYNVNEVEVDEI